MFTNKRYTVCVIWHPPCMHWNKIFLYFCQFHDSINKRSCIDYSTLLLFRQRLNISFVKNISKSGSGGHWKVIDLWDWLILRVSAGFTLWKKHPILYNAMVVHNIEVDLWHKYFFHAKSHLVDGGEWGKDRNIKKLLSELKMHLKCTFYTVSLPLDLHDSDAKKWIMDKRMVRSQLSFTEIVSEYSVSKLRYHSVVITCFKRNFVENSGQMSKRKVTYIYSYIF